MMPLLPPNPLVIDSPLAVDEALERLRKATSKPRWVVTPFNTPATEFEGEVTGHEFRIRRAIGYNNSWQPRIRGHVEPRAEGCRVTATLALHPLVLLFTLVWFGAALSMFIPAVIRLFRSGDPTSLALSGTMLLFGGGLALGGYGFEANVARDKLTALFQADPSRRSPATRPGAGRRASDPDVPAPRVP